MAKSKSGGTRAYIRGRVGSDVYSVGKTAKGKKQQVVRSLAETVANPQTEAQMFGRMIMSTVMQAVAAMRPIIDHSFDNVTGRQPNISEFIARNYALIKADAIAHPSSGNKFGLNKYQEKGAKGGEYIISDGQVPYPSALAVNGSTQQVAVTLSESNHTYGDLKAALGLENGDYITLVTITESGTMEYLRLYLKSDVADTTVISDQNASTLFTQEMKGSWYIGFADATFKVNFLNQDVPSSTGCILSKKTANGWEHSTSVMKDNGDIDYASDSALPTYPTGSEQFLNGGDIF